MATQETIGTDKTERVLATVSRDHWWRCLFEQSEDAQLVCHSSGHVAEINKKATQLLGTDFEAIKSGRYPLAQHFTAATARKVVELLHRTSGRQESLSSVTLLNEGRICLMVDLQITPLGSGFSLVTLKDASRRWRLESHVQRLMSAVDATPDVIFLTDTDFKIVYVNAAFHTVTGYTMEDALGRTADFLRSKASLEKTRDYLASVIAGSDWMGELINVRDNGVQYPVEATISPLYDKDGGFNGYVAFERDISVRKRLQEELTTERNYISSIINSLDSAVYTIDRNFRLSYLNEGWKKMPREHGWLVLNETPQAGRPLLDYVADAERRKELQSVFETVLRDGKPHDLKATCAQGRHWSVKVTPWLQEGEMRGLNYIVTDQTRYHELERQLLQAQKMEVVGALAAGVAHDFNNLLQVISGNTSLVLLDNGLSEGLRRKVQNVEQAATRASNITQQLLSFSRASEEKVASVDLNQVIHESSELAQRSLMCKIDLNLEPAPKPALVRMDATRAQQLLLNLCVNAQDAMPRGGKLTIRNHFVTLSADQSSRTPYPVGTEFLCCSVSDTGTGIPPELLRRIFDPFFTTKEKGKGTGLGLAIVQTVVNQANGFIEVESEPGHGTTFRVFLPCAHADAAVPAKTAKPSLLGGCGRILVVDDLDLVLDLTGTFLRAMGYEVLEASSGEAALEAIQKWTDPIDLVFTDYNMKGMNGREMINKILDLRPAMRFIMASGYLNDRERKELQKDPRIRVLDKPFHMREAAVMIAETLEARSTAPTHTH